MMIDTIKFGCALCGAKYIVYKLKDKLFKTNNTKELIYECAQRADPKDYEKLIKLQYKAKTGKYLNLENPMSFNEKIQWMKLYDSTPLKTKLADKYSVRDYVAEKIGSQYLIPLIGKWKSFDEINFDELPNKFVLKTNHGSGWNAVIRDKSDVKAEILMQSFDGWLKTDFSFFDGNFEMHYSNINPQIIAEEYIEQVDEGLYDYKIHLFEGKATIIQVIGDRNFQAHSAKEAFFDTDWNRNDTMYHTYEQYEVSPPKPEKLSDMLQIAEKLADGFDYVRVDLYNISGVIYFGEMTFTPASGFGKWNSDEIEYEIGKLISNIPRRPTE